VSSHLLAEMAQTADRLLVIGRGRLIAATTVGEFVTRAGLDTVRVRTPDRDRMCDALTAAGLSPTVEDSAVLITGASTEQVGELAARHGLTLHELSVQRASLEEAYMALTDDAVDYRTRS
jgi:ABC-2 type transport system ATP-binding protein